VSIKRAGINKQPRLGQGHRKKTPVLGSVAEKLFP
jgi:hypothetical protein